MSRPCITRKVDWHVAAAVGGALITLGFWVLTQAKKADTCWYVTQQQTFRFSCILDMWVAHREQTPGATLAEALSTMSRDGEFGQYFAGQLRDCPLILGGRDAWGNSFVFRSERLRSGSNGVVFRSCGRNGRDDNGQGDDIQIVVAIPESQPRPETQPHGHERDNGAGSLLSPGSRPQQAQP